MYQETKVFKAHEKLRFPKISEEKQCEFLVFGNFEIIQSLVPDLKDEPFPLGIINHYITIDFDRLNKYLVDINFIDYNIKKYNGNLHSDGVWIKKQLDGTFEVHHQERGNSYHINKVATESKLLEYFTRYFGENRIKKST